MNHSRFGYSENPPNIWTLQFLDVFVSTVQPDILKNSISTFTLVKIYIRRFLICEKIKSQPPSVINRIVVRVLKPYGITNEVPTTTYFYGQEYNLIKTAVGLWSWACVNSVKWSVRQLNNPTFLCLAFLCLDRHWRHLQPYRKLRGHCWLIYD